MMKNCNNNLVLLTFMVVVFLFQQVPVMSQLDRFIDNSYLTGAKKKEVDTLHLRTAKEIADQTAGLLEKEINPEEYLMGPGDELLVSIVSSKTIEHKVTVSPDGKILIPGIGIVDVKGKNLVETEDLIQKCVDKVLKSYEVFISLLKLREFKVIVSGSVRKPAIVPATAADRVSEIIERAGGLKYDASVRQIILLRNDGKEIIPVDLLKFNSGYKNANPTVLGGDHIIVSPSNEEHTIEIWGEVPLEGIFEYFDGDSLSTIFKFSHGFLKSADLSRVEIARFESNNGNTERFTVDISTWEKDFQLSKNLQGDIPLFNGDRVFVRPKANWQEKRMITIEGEVLFPGKYSINKDDSRVYDILKRAGGPTDEASLESAILTRQKEIEKVDQEMVRLGSIPYSEMSENERRYFQARRSEQKGVMAIDFNKIWTNPNSEDNIVVIDEDSIYVPSKKIFINVQGRVNNPGLVVYKKGYTYLDYINLAGGFGFRAEEDETLVVKKKGEQFLAKRMNYELEPGDNILVPPEYETKIDWWLWATQLTTMVSMILAIITLVAQSTRTTSSK